MKKCIGLYLITLLTSSLALATADLDSVSECVWDKYFTKTDTLKLKVEELDQKEQSEINAKKKASLRLEKAKLSRELNEAREKKKAFDVFKKEKFFDNEEGLKSIFPDEFADCASE